LSAQSVKHGMISHATISKSVNVALSREQRFSREKHLSLLPWIAGYIYIYGPGNLPSTRTTEISHTMQLTTRLEQDVIVHGNVYRSLSELPSSPPCARRRPWCRPLRGEVSDVVSPEQLPFD